MTRARRCDPRAGFLLAEALVTLALSALILTGLAALVSVLVAAGDRAATRAQAAEVAARLAAALDRDIGAALPVRWAGEDAAVVLEGEPDRLLFARADDAGLVAVRLDVAAAALTRAEAPLPPAATAAEELAFGRPVNVVELAAPMTFRYVGRDGDVASAWSGAAMPVAVVVEIAGATQRIALRVDAEPGCGGSGDCSLRPADATRATASEPDDDVEADE